MTRAGQQILGIRWKANACPPFCVFACSIMTELKSTQSEENTLESKGYKLIKFVGEGAYAKVKLATHLEVFCGYELWPCQQQILSIPEPHLQACKVSKHYVVYFVVLIYNVWN